VILHHESERAEAWSRIFSDSDKVIPMAAQRTHVNKSKLTVAFGEPQLWFSRTLKISICCFSSSLKGYYYSFNLIYIVICLFWREKLNHKCSCGVQVW
jgi:hypothetical protein